SHQTGSYSHRPNWRNDASGAGRGVPTRQRVQFVRKAVERPPIFRLSEHDVSKAFKSQNARADVSKDELATLEFQFLEALEHGKYGIPNLERQICANPARFVQAVALAFRRNDGGTDPDELGIQDAARREAAATRLPASGPYQAVTRHGRAEQD